MIEILFNAFNEEILVYMAIFSVIFVAIQFFVGFRIILKYFSHGKIEFITVGLTWIFLSMTWWGLPIGLIFDTFFNFSFIELFYLILTLAFIPMALFFWVFSVSYMVFQAKKKIIILYALIICASYEILFIVLLVINQDLIGYVQNNYYVIPNIIPTVFLIFSMIISVIFAVIFARRPLRSDEPKIRWKAKFLILAFISLIFGATFELFTPVNIVTFIIARSILLSSAFEYYFAFFLPEKIFK